MQPQAQPKIIEHPTKNEQDFDLRTHIKDAKTGQLLRVQPYTMHVQGNPPKQFFERPPKSGNLFYPSGESAGTITDGVIKEGAPHREFTAPITNARTFQGVVNENETLRAELDALKAEKEKKPAAKETPAGKETKA